MDRIESMTLEMADEIATRIVQRTERFDEGLTTSIKVVLFGYGDGRRIAHCIDGDWSGPKSEMAQAQSGLPLCPRCGRPATEDADGWRLALVKDAQDGR